MSGSQFILQAITILIVYKTVIGYKNKQLSRNFTLLWLIFWGAVSFSIFQPNLLTKIANFLGIGRGVDLAIYISIIFIFYLIFKIFALLDQTNKKMTYIIRELALKEPTTKNKKK